MNKEKIFKESKLAVTQICEKITGEVLVTDKWLSVAMDKHRNVHGSDRIVEGQLIEYNKSRLEELNYLASSPYFVRCDILMEGKNEEEILYFGKFGYSQENIYSWVVPASSVRFEEPGEVKYTRPDGTMQRGQLKRKDQFMIVGGEIKFLASESLGSSRELVYQDQFSNRKTGFMLPEIVAQMEKAQDQVIRAYHIGPMLISGPAGSGKTTLALHRVAYLLQSPDLENIFSSDTILVLVQDNGTKEYFSALLPGLGINNVSINTFSNWAFSVLGLGLEYQIRIGKNDEEKDLYEYAKLLALKEGNKSKYDVTSIFEILENIYRPFLNSTQLTILKQQKETGVLDKIDLTVLLEIYKKTYGSLGGEKEYYEELENGKIRKNRSFISLNYSLIIVDEFQNYLPKQLELIKSCASQKTKATVYVGDMAQQVQFGTIKNFQDIGEEIEGDRRVVLQKVYRNTRSILEYISQLGYKVEIPEGIKVGLPVLEYQAANAIEEISYIKTIIKDKSALSVGILAKDEGWLSEYQKEFSAEKNIHLMSMNEAQGVEFDIVFLVGISNTSFKVEYSVKTPAGLIEEKLKINRDLLYVALTRAISELYVLGSFSLKQPER